MDFPPKTELQNNLHKLVQECRNSRSKIKELTISNDILKTENKGIKLLLDDQNESDLKLLKSQQGLISHVAKIHEQYEKLRKNHKHLQEENKNCLEKHDSDLQHCLEMHRIEVQNIQKKFQEDLQKERESSSIKEAISMMELDQLKTEHEQMKNKVEMKLEQTEYALNQQRSENAKIKNDCAVKESEIRGLKEQEKHQNETIRLLREKLIAIESKTNPGRYKTTTASYRNSLMANVQKYDPLDVMQNPGAALREQMSKVDDEIDCDSYEPVQNVYQQTSSYFAEEQREQQPIYKPVKPFRFHSVPHQIASVVIDENEERQTEEDTTAANNTKATVQINARKRKLYNPNSFSSLGFDN